MAVPEAGFRSTKYGPVPDGDGWFRLNVGAGDGPAVVLAVGARGGRKGIVYLVAPAAVEHGAGVERFRGRRARGIATAGSRTSSR